MGGSQKGRYRHLQWQNEVEKLKKQIKGLERKLESLASDLDLVAAKAEAEEDLASARAARRVEGGERARQALSDLSRGGRHL